MGGKNFRLQIWFEGHVQGVGFRYKANFIAKGYDVSGFVRNLDDGRVHLLACGAEREVREYAAELKRAMADVIKKAEEYADFTDLKYKGFTIEL
ncbi:MAG: acylphosphatase [Opitutales bacterium]|nr:acylphosphatase [Opitutales bacterium]